jgi:hypothetical protein
VGLAIGLFWLSLSCALAVFALDTAIFFTSRFLIRSREGGAVTRLFSAGRPLGPLGPLLLFGIKRKSKTLISRWVFELPEWRDNSVRLL